MRWALLETLAVALTVFLYSCGVSEEPISPDCGESAGCVELAKIIVHGEEETTVVCCNGREYNFLGGWREYSGVCRGDTRPYEIVFVGIGTVWIEDMDGNVIPIHVVTAPSDAVIAPEQVAIPSSGGTVTFTVPVP
ncbi:MAG: hypothetical protein ABIH78_00330 [Candidatus Peregrinibacteria bacterium]